jgi:hypothetical protein
MIIYIIIFILLIILLYVIYLNKINNIYESFTDINNKYTAVIIEPRQHKALEYVLDNFLTNLDDNWNFIIFHGNMNKEYVENIINNKLSKYKNKIKLKNLNIDNLNLTEYNNLLVSKDFYNEIDTEVFLIFQTDSIICSDYKDLINNYIKYDYVGAPWRDKNIGNGGLSLRRKTKMLEIINNCEYDNKPEDVYFSLSCPNIHRNIPSFEESQKFSVETVYNDISFGVHKPWIHLKNEYIINKNNFCKGLDKLKILNKR